MESENVNDGTTQDTIAIHEASDEDLRAFLDKAHKGESEEAEGGEELEPAQTEKTNEGEKEAAPPEETDGEVKLSRKEFDQLQEELEARKKQVEQQELFIKRRNSEVGELRKRLLAQNRELEKRLDDGTLDTNEVVNAKMKIKENEKAIEAAETEELALGEMAQAAQAVARYVKPEDANMDDLVRVLQDDGVPNEFIQAFRANPYASAPPTTIIHMAKRAKAEKLLRQLVGYTKKLLEERKSLKQKPDKVLASVESALKTTPSVNGSNGGSAIEKSGKSSNPAYWSDAEVKEFLRSQK